jgi:DNA-binding NarL/FixJ family response regulator
MEITIIIADDHPIVRKGLREIIEEDVKLRVISEVNNGKEAVEAIEKHAPKVTILDVDMPVMNGFEAAREIKSKKLQTEIIFLTMHRDEDLFNEAIDLGAKGFVLKDSALGDIVECIKAVAANEHYASHALTKFLINRSRRAIGLSEKQPSINDLTPTERKVQSAHRRKASAEYLPKTRLARQSFASEICGFS